MNIIKIVMLCMLATITATQSYTADDENRTIPDNQENIGVNWNYVHNMSSEKIADFMRNVGVPPLENEDEDDLRFAFYMTLALIDPKDTQAVLDLFDNEQRKLEVLGEQVIELLGATYTNSTGTYIVNNLLNFASTKDLKIILKNPEHRQRRMDLLVERSKTESKE